MDTQAGERAESGEIWAEERPWWRETLAALDLGTNNCRLLIARPQHGGFRVIDAFSRIVRLGEGLAGSGRLSDPAIARTMGALHVCGRKMRRKRVTRLRAVATEACRRAANCEAFLARVRAETGIELEIISSDEEASLALASCAPLLDRDVPHALVFDIGGGSTQVSWLSLGPCAPDGAWQERPAARRRGCVSVPIGVVTLAEAHGGRLPSRDSYPGMVAEVAAALAPFEAAQGLSKLVARGELQMLGTSGTVTTLAGVHQGLPRYERARVDGARLSFETIRGLSEAIAGMSYEERRSQPCIGSERADLVVAGCAILDAICRTWPVGSLRVADRGLREGILFHMMQGGAAGARPGTQG